MRVVFVLLLSSIVGCSGSGKVNVTSNAIDTKDAPMLHIHDDHLVNYFAEGDQRYRIKCDKCGSDFITIRQMDVPPIKELTIDQFIEKRKNPVTTFNAVLKYRTMEIKCNSCGYSVKYSEPIF